MRTPFQLIKDRVRALVRREIADSIAIEIVPKIDNVQQLISIMIKRIDDADGRTQAIDFMTADVVKRLDSLSQELQILNSRIRAEPFRSVPIESVSSFDGSTTIGFDVSDTATYVDFVDVFRPTFEDLYEELSQFRRWFPTSGVAVDLGAGRGEMVKVMADHGLKSFGVDADASVVAAAVQNKVDVRHLDVGEFFAATEPDSVDLVTAIQVVEHVETPELEFWFKNIKTILKDGGVLLIETPNPHAIDAFKAFWIDVTHVRPYYPESLLHLAQAAGFTRAEIWVPGEQTEMRDRLGFAGSYVLIATA